MEEDYNLEMIFPSLEEDLPDVWGLFEPLSIEVSLSRGEERTDGKIKLHIDGEVVDSANTDETEKAQFNPEFESVGKYEIKVSNEENGLEASNHIRIIDYREEIIRLFKSSFNTFRDLGLELKDETTPREFQSKIEESDEFDIDPNVIDDFITLFEIAGYSLHEIRRKEYKETFLAYEKIVPWEVDVYDV